MGYPFSSASGAPLGMKLKIMESADHTIRFQLLSADAELSAALERSDILGKNGALHFNLNNFDSPCDEWIEFILRIRYMPYLPGYIAEKGGAGTVFLVQYLDFLKDWRLVKISCRKDSDLVSLLFDDPNHVKEPATLPQWTALKRIQHVSKMVVPGYEWTLDNITRQICLSGRMSRLLGVSGHAAILSIPQILTILHEDNRNEVISALDNIDTGIMTYQSRYLKKNGDVLHFDSYATPVYDDNGQLARIVGFSRDVSAQVIRQDKLEKYILRFDHFAKNSKDLFFIFDRNGENIYLSPHTEQVLGVTSRELSRQKSGASTAQSDEKAKIIADIRKAIHGRTSNTEVKIKGADGKNHWYAISLLPVAPVDEADYEIIAVGHDVTKIREKEKQLHYLIYNDPITLLPNRKAYWDYLGELRRESPGNYCLVLVDINGLRFINNVFGHQKGDLMLKEVAKELGRIFQEKSRIFRIDGDNFAVIAQDCDIMEVERLAVEITRFSLGTHRDLLPISVSWGACCLNEVQTPEDMYRIAESRMMNNKLLRTSSSSNQLVQPMKEILRTRTSETAEHMARMEYMVSRLGKRLGISVHDNDRLTLLASLHDIGKLGVPDHIVKKPGALTNEEWQVMRSHCEIGYNIAMSAHELSGIAEEILCHHERWDGTGYPNGKAGSQIPLLSQIISVVDAYDAMTHDRVYRTAIGHDEALRELKRGSGGQFSPAIAQLFLTVFKSLTEEEPLQYQNQ